MRLRHATALVVCLCYPAIATISATDHKRKDRDVLIDNKSRRITIYDNPLPPVNAPGQPVPGTNGRVAHLRSAQTLTIKPNEVVTLGIERQNPLIFKYSLRRVVLSPTADFTAASAFAGALTKLIGVAPIKRLEERISLASGQQKEADTARLSKVRELLNKVGFTDEKVAEIADLRNDLIDQVKSIRSLRKQSLDDSQLEAAKGTVRDWKVEDQKSKVTELFAIVANARNALLGALAADPTLFDTDSGLTSVVNMLSAEEANVRRLLTTAIEFSGQMALVGTPLRFGEPITFDAANDSLATIAVDYTDGAEELVKEAQLAVQPMIGEITVTFEPQNSLALGGGPSVLYVFRKNQEGTNIGWRPVGMLTVTRRSFLDGLAAPHLELGVTPESDHVGLYLGVGLRVRGVFHLSGGVTVQQMKKEKGSDWPPSGYLGVTVDLVSKK